MEADHGKPPTNTQHIKRLPQHTLQIIELTVDVNADRLKCSGGRVLVFLPGRIGILDEFRELQGTGQRSNLALLNYCASHAPGKALLAVAINDVGDFLFRRGSQPLNRKSPTSLIA